MYKYTKCIKYIRFNFYVDIRKMIEKLAHRLVSEVVIGTPIGTLVR